MCGIIGYMSNEPVIEHLDVLLKLIKQSKIRGLHAFGTAYDYGKVVAKFLTLPELEKQLRTNFPFCDAIVHTRYSTSGNWEKLENNQPVVVGKRKLIFNGVISMKTKVGMEKEFGCKLNADNDGEIFLQHVSKGGHPAKFVQNMAGSFAGLWYDNLGGIHALRNERRPMWWFYYDQETVFFCSTQDIINRALGAEFAESAIECIPGQHYFLEDLIYE